MTNLLVKVVFSLLFVLLISMNSPATFLRPNVLSSVIAFDLVESNDPSVILASDPTEKSWTVSHTSTGVSNPTQRYVERVGTGPQSFTTLYTITLNVAPAVLYKGDITVSWYYDNQAQSASWGPAAVRIIIGSTQLPDRKYTTLNTWIPDTVNLPIGYSTVFPSTIQIQATPGDYRLILRDVTVSADYYYWTIEELYAFTGLPGLPPGAVLTSIAVSYEWMYQAQSSIEPAKVWVSADGTTKGVKSYQPADSARNIWFSDFIEFAASTIPSAIRISARAGDYAIRLKNFVVTATYQVGPMPTSIAVAVYPSTVDIGTSPSGTANIVATLTPAAPGENHIIVLYFGKAPSGPWTILASGMADAVGQFATVWTPPETGTFYFRADFTGDPNHTACTTPAPASLVAVPEFPSSIAGMLVILSLAAFVVLSRRLPGRK